jgi:hypothetical protein
MVASLTRNQRNDLKLWSFGQSERNGGIRRLRRLMRSRCHFVNLGWLGLTWSQDIKVTMSWASWARVKFGTSIVISDPIESHGFKT